MVPSGTILVTSIASIGKNTLLTREGSFNQQINGVIPNENNYSYFLLTMSELWSRKMKSFAGSGTMQIVNKSEFSKLLFFFPSHIEQTKIGNLFQKLDNLIALHQRKLELLKQIKKVLLKNVFDQSYRFNGFDDEWEQRKLSDLFSKGGSGGTPLSTNKQYYGGKIPFLGISDITNSNGLIKITEKYITEEGLKNSAAWIVPEGSISLAMYASVGKLSILGINLATSQAFYNMVFDVNETRDFVYQRLAKARDFGEWVKLISTGTQGNLNADKVKNFEINYPKNKIEISKVSSLLMKVDDLIALHQVKLDELKQIKKTLLQKMFV